MKLGVPALLLGVGLNACGGETDKPRPEAQVCRPILPLSDTKDTGGGAPDCNALDGLELFLIDNFELGEASSSWYVNNDRTALSFPLPNTDPVASEIPGGRCAGAEPSDAAPRLCSDPETPLGECDAPLDPESRRAMHILSGNLSTDGGQLGRNFPKVGCIVPVPGDESTQCPYRGGPPQIGPCSIDEGPTAPLLGCNAADDMSGWEGIAFWGRKGPGSQSDVRVRVSDVNTDEASCRCNPFTDENDTTDGCDKFGSHVLVDDTFRVFLLPFSEMQQGGWGQGQPGGIETSEILSVGFDYGRGAWDLWIDDVYFYRRLR